MATFGSDIVLEGGAAIVSLRNPNHPTAPTSPFAGQTYFNTVDNHFYGWNNTEWIKLSFVVTGGLVIKGEIANANTAPAFPASPQLGDVWFVTTTSGTIGGITVEIGDQLVRGSTGWFVLQANTVNASTTVAGLIAIATQAEVNAGSDVNKAVTAGTLAQYLINRLVARKVVTQIASLAANTVTTVTHGLGLLNSNELQVTVWQGGRRIEIDVALVSVNAITVKSLVAYSNVTVICQG